MGACIPGATTGMARAATRESGPNATMAVGSYPQGASPYGLLDMTGNVWEWTSSLWGTNSEAPQFAYPYQADDGRENLQADPSVLRVGRGGGWPDYQLMTRSAFRAAGRPDAHVNAIGFRTKVTPSGSQGG